MACYKTILAELNRELTTPIEERDLLSWKISQDGTLPAALTIAGQDVTLRYPTLPHFCRLVGYISEHRGEQFALEEQAHFEELSFMVDCSRNAVPTVETVKKLLRRLALMGYHALLLYTEDIYELPNYPYFGYLRGRYTQKELRQIDDYAALFDAAAVRAAGCPHLAAHSDRAGGGQVVYGLCDNRHPADDHVGIGGLLLRVHIFAHQRAGEQQGGDGYHKEPHELQPDGGVEKGRDQRGGGAYAEPDAGEAGGERLDEGEEDHQHHPE